VFLATVGLLVPVTLLLAGAPGPGGLLISPVQVYLSPKASTSVLTLRNGSSEAARFQVTVFAWGQRPDGGEPLLTPTEDILVSPPLLILGPAEERKIRIASATSVGAVEKTYRLVIEELRSPKHDSESEPQIRMLRTFSLPIFLLPPKPVTQGHVDTLGVDGRHWSFALKNTGSVHIQSLGFAIKALGSSGETIVERQIGGGYVLAGARRTFEIRFTQGECAGVKRFSVDVKTPHGSATETVEVPQQTCGT
jgi:fimbrial chaperone protein